MTKYYEINEKLAKLSKMSYSFDDYIEGSATKSYQAQVDYAYDLVDDVLEENKEKAKYYANQYAKKLAENINKKFRIDTMHPSVMIAGPSAMNSRKKEKQLSSLNMVFHEYEQIQNYLKKIKDLQYRRIRVEKQGTSKDVKLDNDYFQVIQNEELNRLQLVFQNKPDDSIREILKKNGFRWSPKNKVWQRQLTDNALRSTKLIISLLQTDNNN